MPTDQRMYQVSLTTTINVFGDDERDAHNEAILFLMGLIEDAQNGRNPLGLYQMLAEQFDPEISATYVVKKAN